MFATHEGDDFLHTDEVFGEVDANFVIGSVQIFVHIEEVQEFGSLLFGWLLDYLLD